MSKFTIDGEEFENEGNDANCPQCQRPLWMFDLKSDLIQTELAEKVQAGVTFLRECLSCKPLFSAN